MTPERHDTRRRDSDRRLPELARRYADAMRSGDGGAAEQVVEEALVRGLSAVSVQSAVIAPAMVRIGELWEQGSASVADEHLATAISHRVLVRVFAALNVTDPRSRERIVLAAIEGQHHTLGLRMIADVLEGAGFEILFLGPDVPIASLRGFVARQQPAVTGLAFGIHANVACLADSIAAVHEAAPESRIMLGGRAVPPWLQRAGYPCVAASPDVLAVVEGLLAGPPQSPSPEVEALRARPISPEDPAGSGDDDHIAARLAKAAQETSDVARHYVRLAGTYRELAFRDALTELPNRRAFEERMGEPGKGALLMVDVDYFKRVNDTLGHDAGDSILRLVGQAIVHSIRRPRDFAARIGGDEFAVALPATTLEEAHEVAERIRAAVYELTAHAVSVSIGTTALIEDRRGSQLAADTALYEAKAGGGDRTVEAAARRARS